MLRNALAIAPAKAPRIHELKTCTEYYWPIVRGEKRFEVRKDDRGFAIGDDLLLREWDIASQSYTGDQSIYTITYILRGGQFGLEDGYVVLGLDN